MTHPLNFDIAVEVPDVAWTQRGLCVGEDPEVWFPTCEADEAKPVGVCWACPVREECAAYALRIRERHGVWGGLTEADRKRILRRRGAA